MNVMPLIALLAAFVFQLILCPIGIPMLHRLKIGQYIRELGPEAHKKKTGTPTMGGIMILLSFLAAALIAAPLDKRVFSVLLLVFMLGVVGFLDDFLKLRHKQNEGLKVWQKWILQCLAVGIFLFITKDQPVTVRVPFTEIRWNLGGWYYVIMFLYILGFTNGTNFTDGLDGLLSGVTVVIAVFFAFVGFRMGETALVSITMAMIGALLGFLLFNANPAKVFMGDTGSLAIGGFVSAMAILLDDPIILFLIGFVYVAEVASVILQVGYFKMTHGKRIFKMAPIHHHFELSGMKETQIVAMFMIVTAVLCFIGVYA